MLSFIAPIFQDLKKMDFRKQGFKKADELQHGYELFFIGGQK